MDSRRRLQINWWMWALVSVPWIFEALFQRWQDKGGRVWSDWSNAVYRIQHDEESYLREPLFWDILMPLLAGWIAQYFIMIVWHRCKSCFRSKRWVGASFNSEP
jgi:hypothetical protein